MAGIDNIRSGHSLTNTSRSSQRADNNSSDSKTQGAERSSSSGKDAVSISSQSKEIGNMHNQMASSPAFDSAKVQAIKEAIANGSYVVDPDKLAENMIKYEKELGGLS
ncbi:flagellar biosynthesis anti-sigma factor FlgM [Vibrio viridaestus]|uniref:Negative regulator of flagellin synthesis n=1 Tax=Vibrio viridaestus TaxID=2487322 RepID=A0A3N9TI66_9VIBR|nr:flagellar biosynthesis anti-sigma factor FlgM [Vibrio viridaestus]RQW63988.1 flagellar biosynthesis anti-sigma factor FlgM [Vibrio viridaestus]